MIALQEGSPDEQPLNLYRHLHSVHGRLVGACHERSIAGGSVRLNRRPADRPTLPISSVNERKPGIRLSRPLR
jgi:hypothetical protein